MIVATFGPEGPLQCSGLAVVRYGSDTLHGEFGPDFELLESRVEHQRTPSGTVQQFVYCYCKLTRAA